jgi:acyl-CoA synthetase (AMP-forming)/AMP-acid ligase II
METLADPLARDRRSDDPALVTPDGRERSRHDLITNAYKAGNALRHEGVRRGAAVGIAPVPDLPFVLAFLGAGLLGARVRFDVDTSLAAGARALVVPAADVADATAAAGPGTRVVAVGGAPDDPAVTHWEETVWSENPAFPSPTVESADPLLDSPDGDETITHGEAISAATAIAEQYGISSARRVVLRTSLAHPGAVVAGVLAPLCGGGVTVLSSAKDEVVPADDDLVVTEADDRDAIDAADPNVIDPDDVPI